MLEVLLKLFKEFCICGVFVCLFCFSLLTIWKEIQDTQCFRHSLEQLLWISATGAITLWTGSCLVWMEQRSSLTPQPLLEHSGKIQTDLGHCMLSGLTEPLSPSLGPQGHLAWGLRNWGITSLCCLHKGVCIPVHLEFWATSLLIVINSLPELQLCMCKSLVSETELASIQLVFWKLMRVYLDNLCNVFALG